MSNINIHVPVLYVRWKVSVPVDKSKIFIKSCFFTFQNREWNLVYNFSGSQHTVGLHTRDGLSSKLPYTIRLHVENSHRIIISALTSDLLHFERDHYIPTFFWEKLHSEVEQAFTEIRNKREMFFLVVLKTDGFLTGDSSTYTLCKSLTTYKVPCLENLSEELDNGSNHDVEFQCAGQSVKAHQAVVSARSQVIGSMLSSDMIKGIDRVVKIPDMELEVFNQFLAYLYTGNLDELSFETAFSLYEAGHQYVVFGLARKCSKFLMEHLSVQNACKLLVVADAHSDVTFKEAVVGFMLEHKVPLVSDCWQDFCSNHPTLAILVLNQFCQKVPI